MDKYVAYFLVNDGSYQKTIDRFSINLRAY